MSPCASCGRDLPDGALYCPECGARAVDYLSPSHFNSGMTATSQPQLTVAPDGDGSPWPEEARRHPSRRRGLVLTIIVALAVLLIGVSLEAGMLSTGGAAPVNSPNDPLTGLQIYQAFAANASQAGVSYTNKTVYIQGSVDFGVRIDSRGQYFSTINSGSVILVWSDQASVAQLSSGDTVLAKCWVAGPARTAGGGYIVYLLNCDLIGTSSQATKTSSTISVANL